MVKRVARECFASESFLRTLHNFQIYACCRHCGHHLPTFTVSSLNFPVRLLSFRRENKQEAILLKDRYSAAPKERLCSNPHVAGLQGNGPEFIQSFCMPQVNITGLSRLLCARIFKDRASTQVLGKQLTGWKPEGLRYNLFKTQFNLIHRPTATGSETMASKRSQSEGTVEREMQQHQVDAGVSVAAHSEVTAKRLHSNVPKSSSCDAISSLQSSSDSQSSTMGKASYRG